MARAETQVTKDGGFEHLHEGQWTTMDVVSDDVSESGGQAVRRIVVHACRKCDYRLTESKPTAC